jgi:putative photosynthetic complex assembly protein 2
MSGWIHHIDPEGIIQRWLPGGVRANGGAAMTGTPWLAALAALFLWWFSTGVILWRVRRADNGGPDAHVWSVVLGLPLLIAGVLGFHHTLTDASVTGVHIAFLSALAIWGWIELAFLSGIITGPNRRPCPEGTPEWNRFLRAFGTIAWHEILLAAVTVLMGIMAWNQSNHFGFLTFAVLFVARISAKLNLFFGVANINTEFLPQPLAHLPSHFRRRPMNGFFPVSVTALCFAAGCWLERLIAAPAPGAEAGFALLTALTLLALLEHWFMVLPLPDKKLWRWMMDAPAPKTTAPAHAVLKETSHGL